MRRRAALLCALLCGCVLDFEELLARRVDAEKVDARLTNGVLEVELHRPEVDRPKKVQVKAA